MNRTDQVMALVKRAEMLKDQRPDLFLGFVGMVANRNMAVALECVETLETYLHLAAEEPPCQP